MARSGQAETHRPHAWQSSGAITTACRLRRTRRFSRPRNETPARSSRVRTRTSKTSYRWSSLLLTCRAESLDEREQHREVGVDVAAPEIVAGVGDDLHLHRGERCAPLRGELLAHERALATATNPQHRALQLPEPVPQRHLSTLGHDLADGV